MISSYKSSYKFIAYSALITLSACASYNPRFVPTAVHFNTVIEDTNNKLLLLNIIRASNRRPMYFTRISALRNNFTLGANASVNAALPQSDSTIQTAGFGTPESVIMQTLSRGVNTITPNLTTTYSHTPGFDYQILDSQDFYRGILSPITVETVAHYMLQGWSENFISMLAIESIEIRDDDKNTIKKYDNDPDAIGNLNDFKQFLQCVRIGPLERGLSQTIFTSINGSTIQSIDNLDLFNESRWSIGTADENVGKLILSRPRSDTLAFKKLNDSADCSDVQEKLGKSENQSSSEFQKQFSVPFIQTSQTDKNGTTFELPTNREIHVTTRSISGVIYYLGECLRAKKKNSADICTYKSSSGSDDSVISNIQEKDVNKSDHKNPELEVSLYGTTYIIPKITNTDSDRTFTSLTFVNQMLNLQKAASAAPSTSTVRLVN